MATGGGSSSHLHMDMDMERFLHHQPRWMASHSAGTGKFEAADIKSFGKPSAGRLDNMEYGCVRGASASWTNNEYGSYGRARHESNNVKDEFSNHLDLSLRL
ncbi:hypothetical protein SAY87_029262 [Trapa incisa]|uniref:Uncharacterized protein n=1 Tax=Trapa incisa TaxID=236973 RepID=A0AAN7QSF5_9MYRT|nr:hypothetical protein SAY87_029262 [Trapa incisa]